MIMIREMQLEDLDMVAAIEQDNFSRPWSKKGFADSISRNDTIYLVAEQDGVVLGYVGMWISLDEGEITNVSVAKSMQGSGIGRMLMERLLDHAREHQLYQCILEVRKSNERALGLYTHLGFESMGVRKNFYEAPIEDGLVMGIQV